MRRPGVIGGLALALLVARAGAADGLWGAGATGPSRAQALILQAPTSVTSVHPTTTGVNAGSVALSWTASASSFATGSEVQRAAAPACSSFAAVATVVTTSFTDATAAYNQQYCYRIAAVAQSWRAPSAVNMALSLPPTSGTDTTAAPPYALGAADEAVLSVADASYYTTQAKWARGGAQYLDLGYSPVTMSVAPSAVKVTLIYQASLKPPAGTTMQLLVSPDNGATWVTYSLPVPAAKGTDVTTTVDVLPTIGTATALAQMRLRFTVAVSSGGGFQTSHDLAHVDVN